MAKRPTPDSRCTRECDQGCRAALKFRLVELPGQKRGLERLSACDRIDAGYDGLAAGGRDKPGSQDSRARVSFGSCMGFLLKVQRV